jgi:hypothetical protein
MSDQQVESDLRRLAEAIKPLAEASERDLRARHPRLAGYLDMTILARRLWGGGFDVLGVIYPDQGSADEAVKAAIMHKLIAADRSSHND